MPIKKQESVDTQRNIDSKITEVTLKITRVIRRRRG